MRSSATPVEDGRPGKRLPRAVREQQMLDAAVVVFSQRGYHAAAVDEIAERAGISKPMVYAYLGTKEELFVACLRREGERLMEAVASAVGGPGPMPPPDEQLSRGLRAFFGFVAAHRDGWAVLYRQARGQEPFAEVLAEMRARMAEVVSAMLASAIDASGARVPADEIATMGYALVGAAEALADRVVDNPAEDPDVTADRLMSVIWGGAGALLRGEAWRRR